MLGQLGFKQISLAEVFRKKKGYGKDFYVYKYRLKVLS